MGIYDNYQQGVIAQSDRIFRLNKLIQVLFSSFLEYSFSFFVKIYRYFEECRNIIYDSSCARSHLSGVVVETARRLPSTMAGNSSSTHTEGSGNFFLLSTTGKSYQNVFSNQLKLFVNYLFYDQLSTQSFCSLLCFIPGVLKSGQVSLLV